MKKIIVVTMFLVLVIGILAAASNVVTQINANPNPFEIRTTITCNVEANQFVTIQINDHNGVFIKNLFMGKSDGNMINVTWDGTDAEGNTLPTGKYECVLSYDSLKYTSVKKILVFK